MTYALAMINPAYAARLKRLVPWLKPQSPSEQVHILASVRTHAAPQQVKLS